MIRISPGIRRRAGGAVGTLVTCAAWTLSSGPAWASPTCADVPACVPGITRNAAEGGPCAPKGGPHQYVIGIGANYGNTGATFVCFSNYRTGENSWTAAPPLYGVMDAGSSCMDGWMAQSTDGYPMTCADGHWAVHLSDVA